MSNSLPNDEQRVAARLGEVHTNEINFSFMKCFSEAKKQPKTKLTNQPALRIMGSQNWWFGDPRPLLYTSKPLFFGGSNGS